MTSPRHQVAEEIRLTSAERRLFAVLLEVVEKHGLKETVVRVAGGWVRDKLLGLESHDIDIALNNLTGVDFAAHVNAFMEAQGLKTHRIGVIQANPEQSKHLETAKVKVLEHEVDFVNLRTEDYNERSRIPGMRFGSAVEDATRRDFTINALFYNVSDGKVEDLTGFGLKDLRDGVIRTPLAAAQTFRDDPLRMLRAMRFGSRFGFRLDGAIEEGMRDDTVVAMLAQKVSRERIGVEVVGILEGRLPLMGLDWVHKFGLTNVVFRIPKYLPKTDQIREQQNEKLSQFEEEWGDKAIQTVHTLDSEVKRLAQAWPELQEVDPVLLYLSGLLSEIRPKQVVSSKGKLQWTAFSIIRDTLKLKHSLANQVATVCRGSDVFKELLSTEVLTVENTQLQLRVGRLIREAGALWPLALALTGVKHETAAVKNQKDNERLKELITLWDIGLLYKTKPLLDGKYIMRKLGIAGGPALGKLMESLWDWQILHPKGTKEECEAYLHELHPGEELNPGTRKRLKS